MTTIVIEQMSETMYVGIISKRRKIFTGSTLYSREEAGKRERERGARTTVEVGIDFGAVSLTSMVWTSYEGYERRNNRPYVGMQALILLPYLMKDSLLNSRDGCFQRCCIDSVPAWPEATILSRRNEEQQGETPELLLVSALWNLIRYYSGPSSQSVQSVSQCSRSSTYKSNVSLPPKEL